MDLRHIRYFLAVAEERNFTRAAQRVGIGQPPLSQQIKDLEGELGLQLFRRTPQGAELTEAGEAFRRSVETLPLQAADAVRQAQRAARGETGLLRLGFTASSSLSPTMPMATQRFRSAYPEVELTLVEGSSAAMGAAVRDGALDAAFLRPGSIDLSTLHVHDLGEEPMLAVAPASHPAVRDEDDTLDLQALRDEPLLLTPRAIGPTVFDAAVGACRASGFEPTIGQPAPQLTTVVALVAAGMGFSILPQSLARLHLPGVAFRSIAGVRPVARLGLVYRDRAPTTVRNFLGVLRAL
ncbi:MAG: LysR family transcriptional regulator [Caulobacterales bacterium 68-7]|nr:LysR family transcriptional regulator [Caulobacterales bacterium]OJU08082.1 MAG: LysR family transcriptional regulator [Caulobacterales bacterium 68-7]